MFLLRRLPLANWFHPSNRTCQNTKIFKFIMQFIRMFTISLCVYLYPTWQRCTALTIAEETFVSILSWFSNLPGLEIGTSPCSYLDQMVILPRQWLRSVMRSGRSSIWSAGVQRSFLMSSRNLMKSLLICRVLDKSIICSSLWDGLRNCSNLGSFSYNKG